MARVKKGVNAHKRHKKVLKQAKGFYGAKSCHADLNTGFDKQRCICGTDVLYASVRVMDEIDDFLRIKLLKGLHEAFHAAPGVQRLAYVPSDDFFCIIVRYH